MKGISSDVIALAAVLGSAAVAGVVTLALAGSDSMEVARECIVTEVETAPRVVVALNSGHEAVILAPGAWAGSAEVWEKVFFAHSDGDERLRRVQAELTRAQEGLEFDEEMNRVDEELKRIIDELKRKRRRRGGGGR